MSHAIHQADRQSILSQIKSLKGPIGPHEQHLFFNFDIKYAQNLLKEVYEMGQKERLLLDSFEIEGDPLLLFLLKLQRGIFNRNERDTAKKAAQFERKKFRLIQDVLALGAHVNTASVEHESALHLAIKHCGLSTAQLLIQSGADVSAKDSGGNTPLHTAAIKKAAPEVFELLLLNKADPNARNDWGSTPLQICMEYEKDLTSDNELNQKENRGYMLIQWGATIDVKNVAGYHPLKSAKNRGLIVFTKYLEEQYVADHEKKMLSDLLPKAETLPKPPVVKRTL